MPTRNKKFSVPTVGEKLASIGEFHWNHTTWTLMHDILAPNWLEWQLLLKEREMNNVDDEVNCVNRGVILIALTISLAQSIANFSNN